MQYLLPDKAYVALKWLGLVALPAIATFVGTIGVAINWDATSIAVTIITASGTLVGALLGVTAAAAKPADEESGE